MGTVTLDRLTEDVAALLGESIFQECDAAESPFPDLEDRVHILAPGFLFGLLKENPQAKYAVAKEFSGVISVDPEGVATLRLPADFLELVYVKLSDWNSGVTEAVFPGEPGFSLQSCRFKGIRGNPERPVAVVDRDTSGAILKLYSSSENAKLETGLYLPDSLLSDSAVIYLPDGLYIKLAERLAKAVSGEGD